MKTKPFRLLAVLSTIILTSTIFLLSCNKDGGGGNGPDPDPIIDDGPTVTASIRGIVVDQNDDPVAGANVYSGSAVTTTNSEGVFQFKNIAISAANGFVKVTRAGYFTGSRSFMTIPDRIHNVRIKLLPKTNAGTFSGTSGGTVTLPNTAKLVMPVASVVDAAGNSYTGTVNVAMTWIDPTSPQLTATMPGDLRGITTGGQERGLKTYGMLGVELTSGSGQALKIAPGKTAELTFPIPAAIAGNAPSTIDLWHFDEAKGRWIQEGTATKNSNFYVAQVSHFSFWNCDAPFPLVRICMTLLRGDNNEPLNNAQVRVRKSSDVNFAGYGYTDSLGNLCGLVPKNEPLLLEVLDQCGGTAYSQNVGPFSDDSDVGTLSVNFSGTNNITITGTVNNCTNNPVANGVALIYTAGGFYYPTQVHNGSFTATVLKCNSGPLNFSIVPVDFTAGLQGNQYTGTASSGTTNVGTLQACGTVVNEHLDLTIDGASSSYVVPGDSILTINSADTGAYFNRTNVYVMRINNSTSISFLFRNNASTGTFPLLNCAVVAGGSIGSSQQIISAPATITITEFGPEITGFISGSFAIQMNFGGTTRDVVASFRIRRR